MRSEEQGGLPKTLRTLLHELAHLEKPHCGEFEDIDADWDEEGRIWERAHQLAERWGLEAIFPAEALQKELAYTERMRECVWEAGCLAGTLNPRKAREAYHAICMRAGERGWTYERLWAALEGTSNDAGDTAAVVDFNRCCLRVTVHS